MSEKRKDKKGRVLKEGESQRPDGSYQYRYTDIKGKRKYVYAPALQALRDKEAEIHKVVFDNGLNDCAGEIIVPDYGAAAQSFQKFSAIAGI